eukprot:10571987-Alexandrium_andersonii.AAC.1
MASTADEAPEASDAGAAEDAEAAPGAPQPDAMAAPQTPGLRASWRGMVRYMMQLPGTGRVMARAHSIGVQTSDTSPPAEGAH